MESLAAPMQRVAEAGEWFVRTPSLRLLHVVTDGMLRLAVLEHLTATELLDFNAWPFFVLEAPTEIDDDGWSLRCEELRADWSGLVEAAATSGVTLAPLWPESISADGFERFCLELQMALHEAVRAAMPGLVIVLAPVWVHDGARWRRALSMLLELELLGTARFIVVECSGGEGLPLTRQLVERVDVLDVLDARVRPESLRAEMRARIEALLAASLDVRGQRLTGAAGPSVDLPPREGEPPPPSPELLAMQARQLGISPALLDPKAMHELRIAVFGAALAMADGNTDQALDAQTRARDFCLAHGLIREAVMSELVLGGFHQQVGSRELATEAFVCAHQRASEAGLADLVALARTVLGLDEAEDN